MLTVVVPEKEFYDESREEFVTFPSATLNLEHSLVSLSKWEARWHKPFLDPKQKRTAEETIDYIRCMTINKNVDPNVYTSILYDANVQEQINKYIEDPMTATTINDRSPKKPNREVITSELIYYWMIEFGIPVEFEKWHLSRLMTLIQVCGVKGGGSQKMSKKDLAKEYMSLNAQRRAKLGSKG